MSFVYPVFLAAAAALAVPIIIHLFNFRRHKTVYFTNVRFLQEVKEETASRSKLKHWLVLLSRLLALLFLVLAFAQPFIPVTNAVEKGATEAVSIYIDNSFSMSAEDDGESLLNQAKRKATEIVKAYDASQRFQIVSNDFEARQQLFVSKEEALGIIDELEPSPRFRELKDVEALQKKAFADQGLYNGITYWISDFQKNITDFNPDTVLNISLVPLQPTRQQNLFIDSVWLEKPVVYAGEPNKLMVRTTNSGEEDVESTRLELSLNGQAKAIADVSVQAGSYSVDTLNFTVTTSGWQQAQVSIRDYPVVFDDTWNMAFMATDHVNVLAINEGEPNTFLQALYGDNERITFDNQGAGSLNYSSLGKYNLIVLANLSNIPSGLSYELEKYLQAGGTVLIFPAQGANLSSYNQFLNTIGTATMAGIVNESAVVSYLNREHEIFKDVFEVVPTNLALPEAKTHITFTRNTTTGEQHLLSFRDGTTFLSEFNYHAGKAFLCAVPLNKEVTDFPYHGIFVPLLYRMALTGGQLQDLSYTIGSVNTIIVPDTSGDAESAFKLQGKDSEFIPQQKTVSGNRLLTVDNDQLNAGIYQVLDGRGELAGLAAFNFNRQESYGDNYTAGQLKDKFTQANVYVFTSVNENLATQVNELDRGVVLWKLCIIFVLIFVGMEVLLLRFMK